MIIYFYNNLLDNLAIKSIGFLDLLLEMMKFLLEGLFNGGAGLLKIGFGVCSEPIFFKTHGNNIAAAERYKSQQGWLQHG